jgi:hypothetical protein
MVEAAVTGRVLFLCALWILCDISSGLACSAIPMTKEEHFQKASAVFVAHMIRVEETAGVGLFGNADHIVEGTFRALEILKGKVPADQKIRSDIYAGANCTVPIFAGLDYLIFLYEETQGYVYWPGGTELFLNIDGSEPQALLNRLRALKQ